MKKMQIIFFMLFLAAVFLPAGVAVASQQKTSDRSVLAGIGHLEKRGLANIFLFPAEWGHLPPAEHGGVFGIIPVALTHLCVRLYSGISDAVFLPVAYPFTKYDDSIPVGMGWGEFPWQRGNG